ncbi:hypothetical protein [Prescottella agglutinans]|uniref:Uncharacterized protein n=1 Tax=Prescottella agglutinans TaxID=1644129 RepID=A0ABT6MJI4_9NOCA|nr:hypothetical protein [Prescottella agglutinans]MDH6284054.1 hypothetical protein [Prescottella agglutinans]
MNGEFCEFCDNRIERIPFGGYTHSADRNPRCGRNFATPRKNPATAAGAAVSDARVDPKAAEAGLPA